MAFTLTSCKSADDKHAAEEAAKDLRDRAVGIEGIEIYYGEKTAEVLARLGEADSETDMGYGSGETVYGYENVTAYGVEGASLSVTVKTAPRYDDIVYSVMVRIPTDDPEALFDHIHEYVERLYSDREGFRSSEIWEFEGTYYCSINGNSKDGTESFEISRYPTYVDVTAFYSPFN